MRKSVEAAVNRVIAGEGKVEFATKQLDRYRVLREKTAASQEEFDQKVLDDIQSKVDLQQDKLVQAAMEAMELGTAMMPTMIQQYIDRKGLTVKVYEEQKQEALSKLKQAVEDERRGRMYSPVSGVVLKRVVSNERYLPAGEVLLEIGRMEDLEVEAEVLSQDVVKVKRGDPVSIYGPAIGPKPARGRVEKIYPAGFTKVSSLGVEQQRVRVIVKFEAEDLARVRKEQELGVDYRVRVQIVTAEEANAVVVPRSALFRAADGKWQVMAVRGGRVEKLTISTGLMNDSLVQVLNGLKPGDLVVRAPESRLTDGARVRYNVPQ
jgi:HlyD family secretion protein